MAPFRWAAWSPAPSRWLDSGEFRSRAETALASPDVQDYLADALTAKLVARGGAGAERAEPLVRSVVGGVVASERFQEVFGQAVDGLHARLLSQSAAPRVVELQEAVTRAVDAIAVVDPALAQRLRDASGEISVGQGRPESAWPRSRIACSSCACSGSSFLSWPSF